MIIIKEVENLSVTWTILSNMAPCGKMATKEMNATSTLGHLDTIKMDFAHLFKTKRSVRQRVTSTSLSCTTALWTLPSAIPERL